MVYANRCRTSLRANVFNFYPFCVYFTRTEVLRTHRGGVKVRMRKVTAVILYRWYFLLNRFTVAHSPPLLILRHACLRFNESATIFPWPLKVDRNNTHTPSHLLFCVVSCLAAALVVGWLSRKRTHPTPLLAPMHQYERTSYCARVS